MKPAWVCVLFALASALWAEDWQGTLTPPKAGEFPPLRPLHSTYRFGWQSLPAATADLDFAAAKDGQMELKFTTQTTGMVRSLWRLDATQTALCDARTLLPLQTRQVEKYSGETLTTSLDFGTEGVARLRTSDPPDKNPPRTKHFKFPGVFDLLSALLFVRSQPLAEGEVVRLVVYPSTDPYLAELEVLGRERIAINKQARPAIRIAVRLRQINKKLELIKHDKFTRASAWLSDDADRLLLKVVAEVSVGSVWAELQSVQFAAP